MKKLFVALYASLIAAVFLFGGTVSDAQANPNFVRWTWSWSKQANNNFPVDDTRHANLKVVINYTNVSNNRIVTAIFKKSLAIQGRIPNWRFNGSLFTNKVNKVELYPGQSVKLSYIVPVEKNPRATREMMYNFVRTFFNRNTRFNLSLTHYFDVSSVPLN